MHKLNDHLSRSPSSRGSKLDLLSVRSPHEKKLEILYPWEKMKRKGKILASCLQKKSDNEENRFPSFCRSLLPFLKSGRNHRLFPLDRITLNSAAELRALVQGSLSPFIPPFDHSLAVW